MHITLLKKTLRKSIQHTYEQIIIFCFVISLGKQLAVEGVDPSERNLLHHLLLGTYLDKAEDGKWYRRGLTDEEIVAHINSLIGGGLGTLNASIEFVIHMLAANPAVQEKVYQNIMDVCGSEVSKQLVLIIKHLLICD